MQSALSENKITDIPAIMEHIGQNARKAAQALLTTTTAQKNTALIQAAQILRTQKDIILTANQKDLDLAAQKNLSKAMIDRLALDESRIEGIAKSLENIAALDDPVGKILHNTNRPNGLNIKRISVPIGVIGIIYESRPNVTADAGGLAVKAGNAVILRGGSESFYSSKAIHACLIEGLKKANIPEEAIQLVPVTDRQAVGYMLSSMVNMIDLIIPRGGKSLVERIQTEARVPVLAHLEGLCHSYLHTSANLEKAIPVIVNAKMRRTGICGATETLLIDEALINSLSDILDPLHQKGCEIRGCSQIVNHIDYTKPASDADFKTEYLDNIISVKIVKDLDEAIHHIQHYGSHHTDAILAEDQQAIEKFCLSVDSANIMINTSTQFADGGEFGMGAEIGIATGKLHARGPVGLEQLTSFKYIVYGDGQIRA